MPITTPSPFTDAAIQPATDASVRGFDRAHRFQGPRVVACALGLLALCPVTTFALELGEASIKSGLGQSLLVEIPYRLAANERLAPACVGLVPAAHAADALPTYTRVSRISISPTHIEIFDDNSVREPLIGLTIDVHCDTAPHSVRSYELFVDPPEQLNLANGTEVAGARRQSAIDAAAPVAATLDATPALRNGIATTTATSDPTANTPITRTARANASPRARGHAGGNLTQGQTYRVVRGDTLSGIATRIAERPATIRQTTDAIFAANPNAFARGNRDLIEEGRSITIPIMTPGTATVAALSLPAPLPAVHGAQLPTAAPVPTPNPEPVPTSTTQPLLAADAASIVAPETKLQSLPAAAAGVAEPTAAPVGAPARTDLAPEAPSRATTGHISAWLTALLVLGVLVLLSAPLAFVRRRKQQAAAEVSGKVQKQPLPRRSVDFGAGGIDVVEGRLVRAPADDEAASIGAAAIEPVTDSDAVLPADLKDLALTIGPIHSVDLDVGAPIVMNERVDWFADRADAAAVGATAIGDETIEENAATVRMPGVDTAATVRQQAPQNKADLSDRSVDDDQMTMTIVELDLLRQDYEAEHTLTQQASQALRDAVADLEATKRAHAATAETSTLESPQLSEAETNDSMADAPTARVRMK